MDLATSQKGALKCARCVGPWLYDRAHEDVAPRGEPPRRRARDSPCHRTRSPCSAGTGSAMSTARDVCASEGHGHGAGYGQYAATRNRDGAPVASLDNAEGQMTLTLVDRTTVTGWNHHAEQVMSAWATKVGDAHWHPEHRVLWIPSSPTSQDLYCFGDAPSPCVMQPAEPHPDPETGTATATSPNAGSVGTEPLPRLEGQGVIW